MEEEETWLWDAGEQGGGNYGTEEKKSPGISSHQLPAPLDCRYHGLSGPSSQSPAEQDAGEARGEGGLQGEGQHGGNIASSDSPGQLPQQLQ